MNNHGGYRKGAGRPIGSQNKSTRDGIQRLGEIARTHTELAIKTLVEVAINGRTDAGRVSAANSLIDRGYGKPRMSQEIEIENLRPLRIELMAAGSQTETKKDAID